MIVTVLNATISRNAGGLFVSVRRLSQEIYNIIDSVNVYCLEDNYSYQDIDFWKPLHPLCHKTFGWKQLGYSPELMNTVFNNHTDIIHRHGMWMYPSYVTYKAAACGHAKTVISPRGMLDTWALKNSSLKKIFAGWLFENDNLRLASCIHALCESEYLSIRAYGLKNPVAIIPNGVDLPTESTHNQKPLWQDNVPAGRKVMLFLGRIHPKKGLMNLIKAWSIIKPNDWVLVIAGWDQGGHEEELKRLVHEHNMDKDVLFLGPVFDEKKKVCLQNADAFILPSFSEGLPMSVLEAWSYGLPVIMTSECNIPEGFSAKAAIKIRPQVEAIIDGLNKFIFLSETEQKLIGQNGLQLVKEKFTWPRIAFQMIDVYKWVLGEGNKPDCVRLD